MNEFHFGFYGGYCGLTFTTGGNTALDPKQAYMNLHSWMFCPPQCMRDELAYLYKRNSAGTQVALLLNNFSPGRREEDLLHYLIPQTTADT